jgi:UPF0271 protein
MSVPAEELTAEVLYQIAALDGIARAEGGRVGYVKPHGALYNRAVWDAEQAGAIVAAIRAHDPGLPLLTLPGSAAGEQARAAGLTVVTEAFADRAYTDEATLVPRTQPGAVLTDPQLIARRVTAMVTGGTISSVTGAAIRVSARSVCVHGDTPGAVALARAVRTALEDSGVAVAAFA